MSMTPSRLLAVTLIAASLAGCGGSEEPKGPRGPAADVAIHPEITHLTPETLGTLLTGPADRPRVVNFWATWCGPCVTELPELEAFAAKNPEVDVILVNVDVTSVLDAKVKPFVGERDLGHVRHAHLAVRDPARVLPRIVPEWPSAIPYTLVIDASGEVVQRFPREISREDLVAAIGSAG